MKFGRLLKLTFCTLIFVWLTAPTLAAPRFDVSNPLDFFTNVTAELFRQLNLHDASGRPITVTNIPVYPTRCYTPAVHRIFQLAANLYDSTRTNNYPTIFRPYFSSDGTNIVISGYELVNAPEDTNTSLSFLTLPQDLNAAATRAAIGTGPAHINIYGVPWIIGAKKGLPNFNQVAMETVSQITREMKVSRPNLTAPYSQYQFAQMYLLGISNVIGVSVWNSYSNNYPGSVYIQADGFLSMSLTNDFGLQYSTGTVVLGGTGSAISLGPNQWQGSGWISGASLPPKLQSFQIPLFTNYVFLPNSAYQQSPPAFVTPGFPFVWPNPAGAFPQPQWGLNITNHLRCVIFDNGPTGRVIDYVQLAGMDVSRALTTEIQTPNNAVGFAGIWSANTVIGFGSVLPAGILNQINISLGSYDIGNPSVDGAMWQYNMLAPPYGSGRELAVDLFRAFMKFSPLYYPNTVNTNLEMVMPFIPTATRLQLLTWEANDPLVHYLATDLQPPANKVIAVAPPGSPVASLITNLSFLNFQYSPWGRNPTREAAGDTNAYNLAIKDPAIFTPDAWDFPNGAPLSFATIGRVHRGTPWQTVYLKSSDVDSSAWAAWTGDSLFWNTGNGDATLSRPIKDHDVLSVIYPLLSTDNQFGQISINDHNADTWLAALDGLATQTNSSPPAQIIVRSNSSGAAMIGQSIVSAPATGLFMGQKFAHLGDLLEVPQLSDKSPFLDFSNLQTSNAGGLSDEVIESLPAHLLPLLRDDSFASITYTNEQLVIQFTGNDFFTYVIQASANLTDWENLTTNVPSGGIILIQLSPTAQPQFYRSVLLP